MSLWASALDGLTTAVRDTFPAVVIYTRQGHAPELITAVFDEAHESVSIQGEVAVSTTQPALTVRLADLSGPPRRNDTFTVAGRTYRVSDVQPDGAGMSRLMLTEA